MKKMTSRQIQAQQTKLKISQCALKLYKNMGIEDVKVTDICQEANISIGAFYHHFPSKNSIITTAYQALDQIIIEKVLSQKLVNPQDIILAVFNETTVILADYGYHFVSHAYRVMLNEHDEATFSKSRLSYTTILQEISKAQQQNILTKNKASEEIADFLMKTGRGLLFDWCLHQGNYDLKKAMNHDLCLVINLFKD